MGWTEWFEGNWPVLLVTLGLLLLVMGVIRKLMKLAFFGVVVGVLAMFIWRYLPAA